MQPYNYRYGSGDSTPIAWQCLSIAQHLLASHQLTQGSKHATLSLLGIQQSFCLVSGGLSGSSPTCSFSVPSSDSLHFQSFPVAEENGGLCKKLTELHSDPDFESGLSITQPYVYASRHSTSNRHAHTSACTLRRLCHEPARVIRQQASPQGITGVEDTSGLFSSEAIHSQHHHIGKPKLTHT